MKSWLKKIKRINFIFLTNLKILFVAFIMENLSLMKQLTLHSLAGGSAGIIMDIICFPLETLKTRVQVF